MKNGAWNVRGLNKELKQKAVVNLLQKDKLNVLGIMEAKLTSEAGIEDLRFTRCRFTWTNGHVVSKLDRVMMVNALWLEQDRSSYVEFRPLGVISDHTSCLVAILDSSERRSKPFKFFNMWTTHPRFMQTVQQCWASFSGGTERARVAQQHLLEVQQRTLAQGWVDEEFQEARKAADRLTQVEYLFYQQRAKHQYFMEVDRPTTFFHSMVKRNNKRREIVAIERGDGSLATTQEDVAREFVAHFQAQLGAQAPGPDGYSSQFFKHSWDTVGVDFTAAILEFFQSGRLLRSWNHTLIALIPKTNHAATIHDYKPISYYTVFYKVISKLLASRLAEVTGILLHPAQTAFVRDQLIIDNIHLEQELLRRYTKKCISPRCTLKVDLQKVFDSVHWDFLQDVLIALHFPAMDPRALRIAHLVYADNLLLLSRGDTSSVTRLVECLRQFSQMAGLTANVAKSCIYIAGVDSLTRDQLLSITGFQQGEMPFRYLGIPIALWKLRISDYTALLDTLL
ncbi:uncharacterized protein LOC141836051 [Curcuma longa]|uniref:uncharacterized protein LOC141836051 n=1 Tax=Curcuma longa TaxID=136217 RepID=UPI003D9DCFB0